MYGTQGGTFSGLTIDKGGEIFFLMKKSMTAMDILMNGYNK